MATIPRGGPPPPTPFYLTSGPPLFCFLAFFAEVGWTGLLLLPRVLRVESSGVSGLWKEVSQTLHQVGPWPLAPPPTHWCPCFPAVYHPTWCTWFLPPLRFKPDVFLSSYHYTDAVKVILKLFYPEFLVKWKNQPQYQTNPITGTCMVSQPGAADSPSHTPLALGWCSSSGTWVTT